MIYVVNRKLEGIKNEGEFPSWNLDFAVLRHAIYYTHFHLKTKVEDSIGKRTLIKIQHLRTQF